MAETMTGRDYYIQNGYNELPEAVRIEMSRIFDTGVNNSGVWVRYKEVENLAGIMAYEYTHRAIKTKADCIRTMTDEELADHHAKMQLIGEYGMDSEQTELCKKLWLQWLQSPADEGNADDRVTRRYS